MRKLMNDEAGFVISAELVLVLTIAVLAMVVGLAAVRDAVVQELNDLSHAFGAVSQSYNVTGLSKAKATNFHGIISGFGFNDDADECDCNILVLTDVTGKVDPSTGGAE